MVVATNSFTSAPSDYRSTALNSYSPPNNFIDYSMYNLNLFGRKVKLYDAAIIASSIETSLNILEIEKLIALNLSTIYSEQIDPFSYYLSKILELTDIEAVIYEKKDHYYFFETITTKRNIETNSRIYDFEIEMFDKFNDYTFNFAVTSLDDDLQLDFLIINKNVIFIKNTIYAKNE